MENKKKKGLIFSNGLPRAEETEISLLNDISSRLSVGSIYDNGYDGFNSEQKRTELMKIGQMFGLPVSVERLQSLHKPKTKREIIESCDPNTVATLSATPTLLAMASSNTTQNEITLDNPPKYDDIRPYNVNYINYILNKQSNTEDELGISTHYKELDIIQEVLDEVEDKLEDKDRECAYDKRSSGPLCMRQSADHLIDDICMYDEVVNKQDEKEYEYANDEELDMRQSADHLIDGIYKQVKNKPDEQEFEPAYDKGISEPLDMQQSADYLIDGAHEDENLQFGKQEENVKKSNIDVENCEPPVLQPRFDLLKNDNDGVSNGFLETRIISNINRFENDDDKYDASDIICFNINKIARTDTLNDRLTRTPSISAGQKSLMFGFPQTTGENNDENNDEEELEETPLKVEPQIEQDVKRDDVQLDEKLETTDKLDPNLDTNEESDVSQVSDLNAELSEFDMPSDVISVNLNKVARTNTLDDRLMRTLSVPFRQKGFMYEISQTAQAIDEEVSVHDELDETPLENKSPRSSSPKSVLMSLKQKTEVLNDNKKENENDNIQNELDRTLLENQPASATRWKSFLTSLRQMTEVRDDEEKVTQNDNIQNTFDETLLEDKPASATKRNSFLMSLRQMTAVQDGNEVDEDSRNQVNSRVINTEVTKKKTNDDINRNESDAKPGDVSISGGSVGNRIIVNTTIMSIKDRLPSLFKYLSNTNSDKSEEKFETFGKSSSDVRQSTKTEDKDESVLDRMIDFAKGSLSFKTDGDSKPNSLNRRLSTSTERSVSCGLL